MQDVDEPKEAGQGSGKMPREQSTNANIAAPKEVFLRCSDISAHECDPAVPLASSVRLRLTCFRRCRKDPASPPPARITWDCASQRRPLSRPAPKAIRHERTNLSSSAFVVDGPEAACFRLALAPSPRKFVYGLRTELHLGVPGCLA